MSDTGMSETAVDVLRLRVQGKFYLSYEEAGMLLDEVRRLQKEAAERDADAAAMRAWMENERKSLEALSGTPFFDASLVLFNAALDGTAGKGLWEWAVWAAQNLKRAADESLEPIWKNGEPVLFRKPPAFLARAADGGGDEEPA